MEKDKKKKISNNGNYKKKIPEIIPRDKRESKSINMSKITNLSISKIDTSMHINLEYFGQIPTNIFDFPIPSPPHHTQTSKEENYSQKMSEKRVKMKNLNKEIDNNWTKKDIISELENKIKNDINEREKLLHMKMNERENGLKILEALQKKLNALEEECKTHEMKRDEQKKLCEVELEKKSDEILLLLNEIEKENINLLNIQKKKDENKNKIPDIINILLKKEQEINEEKQKIENQTQIKTTLKEEYEKVNKIAINDNIFCHNNFYSLLTFFPYFKNVAFISDNNLINKGNKSKEIKDINHNNSDLGFDENKIIVDEEMTKIENDIDKENINNIKYLLNQNENINANNYNFKILKDRRTLQINLKEKYKFRKIFSTINNNYIAEPWDNIKFTSLKLSTINSYFNEFNMTAINNNYFIIYFVPNLDKTSLNNELHKLYQKLKNNEYIDRNIIMKISVITESNNINLQNTNFESKVKNQLNTITNSGHTIYGFLYEFIKTNRLNKKNIFRLYIFDYSYPQAVDMMNNINKYYAKKKKKNRCL